METALYLRNWCHMFLRPQYQRMWYGEDVFIPSTPLSQLGAEILFVLRRLQFP